MSAPRNALPLARRRLVLAVRGWWITALVGQAAFAMFIAAFYLPPLLTGNPLAMNAKPHLSGWVPGDGPGNAHFVLHVALGGLVTLSGLIQLVPELRKRWPGLHRWNGRFFMLAAIAASLGGFWLTWVRGSQLNLPSALSTTLNGLLIVVFAALAWRSALQRDITAHRRHALRAWLLVNGVWFLRIGILIAGLGLAPLGVEVSYDSAAFLGVSYLSWLLPLALLQLYLAAERSTSPGLPNTAAFVLGLCALLTAAGSVAAMALMWWPYL